MAKKLTKNLTSDQRADQLCRSGRIVQAPTAVTFLVDAESGSPYPITVYPEGTPFHPGTLVATCRCGFGQHHLFMPRGKDCYHAKAAWKLWEASRAA